MDVRVSSKNPIAKTKMTPGERRRQAKQVEDDYKGRHQQLTEDLTESLSVTSCWEKKFLWML